MPGPGSTDLDMRLSLPHIWPRAGLALFGMNPGRLATAFSFGGEFAGPRIDIPDYFGIKLYDRTLCLGGRRHYRCKGQENDGDKRRKNGFVHKNVSE